MECYFVICGNIFKNVYAERFHRVRDTKSDCFFVRDWNIVMLTKTFNAVYSYEKVT